MSAHRHQPAVLVVEDEAMVRMFAVDVLQDEGYEVIEAASAAQALKELERRADIAVVFSDINMPGDMDGIGLAREIQRMRPGVHVILTSGKQMPLPDELPGKSPFVTKPYSAQELVRLLSAAIR